MKSKNIPRIMTGLLILVIAFHLLVMLRLIPYEAVWGGRLKTPEEMYAFETVSIILNLFLLLVVARKANYITHWVPSRLINGILYFFAVVFAFNTLGNLFAVHILEKVIGSALTAAFSGLCWLMAKQHYPEDPTP